ncbi:hypothetical protein [Halomicrococcus sp. NG-SE-24]|uniref:hypothetical protein n=1 Tax=Halomicrococcus sp. NG-SE-24 TaxID=3436928 RepID=UPI003D99DA43
MAGQKNPDDRPGTVWDEIPLIEEDREEGELTAYGRLLAESMFDERYGLGGSDLTDDDVERLTPALEY